MDKKFRHYLIEFDTPQIYCDMDGVLADFEKGIEDMIGGTFNDDRWPELPDDFFLQLEPMPDAKKLWGFIGKYNPFILTAIPRSSRGAISKRATKDKMRFMKRWFGVSSDRIYAVIRKNKKNFAKDGRDGRPNILIDDHIGNIREFKSAGGLGVHHKSASKTISELMKIGYK
mgnify:CR=1 FL=1|tara:strand:+ start:233 stop:748 length:516 start_codon:yes stop_codon:yes gene_type:complete